MQFYFNPDRRKLALDGVEQSGTAEYLRLARLVYFGNTDLELVRGTADGRRRFLDFLGSQIEPLYRANLRAYERALRSRNRLLKAVPVRRREVDAYDTPAARSRHAAHPTAAQSRRGTAPVGRARPTEHPRRDRRRVRRN